MFARVVEHRSFSGAAAAIGVSKATVSKAISRLEARLGTSLFHRTSRKLTLTDSGRALADRAHRILAEAEQAEEAARDAAAAPEGLVRVAAPMTFGTMHLGPILADFLAAHPGISIELHLSDARVDIVAEGFDLALRIADLPDSSLRARRLCAIRNHVVASPDYYARHGEPRRPADLAEHRCLVYLNAPTWRFAGRDGADYSIRPEGPLATNSGDAMLPLLRAGQGIAMLPDFIIAGDLESGALVSTLEDWMPPPIGLHLLTPPGTRRPIRVEALIEFLTQRLRRG